MVQQKQSWGPINYLAISALLYSQVARITFPLIIFQILFHPNVYQNIFHPKLDFVSSYTRFFFILNQILFDPIIGQNHLKDEIVYVYESSEKVRML